MNLAEQSYKEISRAHFNKQASKYEQTWDGKYCRQMYERVLDKIGQFPFVSLLDIGCGSGTMLAMLKNISPHIEFSGIDLSEQMIAQARKNVDKEIQLQIGDVENLPWIDNKFDLVLCNASFHHFPDPLQSLHEIHRVLQPDGRLIIADPWWPGKIRRPINYYLQSPFNQSGDVRIYSQHEITALFTAANFTSVDWELIDRTYFIVSAIAVKQ